MKIISQYLFWVLTFGLGLVACSNVTVATPIATLQPSLAVSTLPIPTPTELSVNDKIRLAVAQQLGVSAEEVQIHTMDNTQWQDSCLGVSASGEVCSQVTTPGYGGIIIAQGMPIEFHSDASGDNVRFIPGAALAARQILSAQLGKELKKVNIVSVEAATWEDTCLEIEIPGQVCAPENQNGYRVTLEIPNGNRYRYHTDESGSEARLAEAPPAQINHSLITWSQSLSGSCQNASFGEDQIAFGTCGSAQILAPYLSTNRSAELRHFVKKYAAFEAETPAGLIKLAGEGDLTATPIDQRMAAEWARLASLEAISGQEGAAEGLVFAWRREGGLAGVCDDITVYLSGIATASSCQGDQPQFLGQTWLTANQMRTIYTWVDAYQDYDFTTGDPNVADGLTTRMIFTGSGLGQMNEFEQTRLTTLAEEILGELQTVPNSSDIESARVALVAYLSALTAGNYPEVVNLYGGSYDILRDNNPTLNPTDYPALFKAGCTFNGFVCNLVVKNFVKDSQLSPTDFRFTVELQNPDSSLFVFGPCCGADPALEPPWTQFDFLVRKTGEKFLAQDLPVYVP